MRDQYGYSVDNPPKNCIECKWHKEYYSPTTGCHMYWYDRCDNIRQAFGKLHVILRGEFRKMSNHDDEDMIKYDALPYECPFFSFTRVFWESYGRIKMDYEVFLYACLDRPQDYFGYYVYALVDVIAILSDEIPKSVGLHYLVVQGGDLSWFITTFGARSVMLSEISPSDWKFIPLD